MRLDRADCRVPTWCRVVCSIPVGTRVEARCYDILGWMQQPMPTKAEG